MSRWSIAFTAGVLAVLPRIGEAQGDQFGGQARADAAGTLIVLAVEQATGSLPPMSGQAFSYEYDPRTDTFARSTTLGPTVLRTARPVGRGKFALRAAVSRFDLDETFGASTYEIVPVDPEIPEPRGFTKFGLHTEAEVGILGLSLSYGILSWLDATLVVPVGIVDASASQISTTPAEFADLPAAESLVAGGATRAELEGGLRDGALVLRTDAFRDLGFDFNDGTNVGVGRIRLSSRMMHAAHDRLRLAFAPEILLPSPSEDEFIGSESLALVPRLLLEWTVGGPLSVLVDAGYEFDVDRPELRRFVGTGGVHLGNERLSLDCGVSGSVYDRPIRWTPYRSYGVETDSFPATVATAVEGITLGDDFVDFLAGVKVALHRRVAVGAGFVVPVNDQGFRPDASFTGSIDVNF